MAKLRGLMAASMSGGEARPNYPDFDRVMMITGEVKVPERVLPVVGFHGQELWPSKIGLRVGLADEKEVEEEGLVVGTPTTARFNYLESSRQHIEGGRFVMSKGQNKRQVVLSPLKVNKRIRQNIDSDSDDSVADKDYVPGGNIAQFVN